MCWSVLCVRKKITCPQLQRSVHHTFHEALVSFLVLAGLPSCSGRSVLLGLEGFWALVNLVRLRF